MKVLVIGSGGREHALAWRIASTPGIETLVAPGNDGMRSERNLQLVDIAATDYERLVAFCLDNKIDFVVVGSDQQLADGLVDKLSERGILAFGPTAAAARIESSKAFAKEVMLAAGIPTARFAVFTDAPAAKKFLGTCGWNAGWALKADGLALGKGVVVTEDPKAAEATIDEFIVGGSLGAAGRTLVIEERLNGREVSAFYACDGERAFELAFACDHKQLLDGGKGPNTGGMGAYSPADWLPKDFSEQVGTSIVAPLLKQMQKQRTPFRGMLFIGLMITDSGPKVIEFNARFGDPETQAIMPLVEGDFLALLRACARGALDKFPRQKISLRRASSVHVVLAAHGYPGAAGAIVRKGDPIKIAEELIDGPRAAGQNHATFTKVFFAGVKGTATNSLTTNGGRVIGLTAVAADRAAARRLAYEKIKGIEFAGMQMRRDVGAE